MHALKVSAILVVLLAMILIAGLYTNSYLEKTADKIENHIVKIEGSTKAENWSQAKAQLSIAKNEWIDTGRIWSMLIDHLETDNIDNALSRMEEYINSEDAPETLAEAATLKQYIKHIPDKEAFKLKNIL